VPRCDLHRSMFVSMSRGEKELPPPFDVCIEHPMEEVLPSAPFFLKYQRQIIRKPSQLKPTTVKRDHYNNTYTT
jgi:hypothetical protein